jgi:molybdopterin-synthase adenylyltransferase
MRFDRPLLPSCFLTWVEPPDEAGDEKLRIVSRRRALTLKGHSFREFGRSVLPLLDGRRRFDEICEATRDLFDRADLEAALATLGEQGVVVEGDGPGLAEAPPRLAPQVNYLGEAAEEGRRAQLRLSAVRVAVFGMGGAGAGVVRALASAGVGRLLLVDPQAVGPADPYFSPLFESTDIGRNRAEVVASRLRALAPEVAAEAVADRPADAGAVGALVAGCDLALCLLESGELNLALKLNRAARTRGLRWLAGALEGTEVVAGPGFPPSGEGPCYMCARMREVACAGSPEARFALEQRYDRLREDLGGRRENTVFGADLLAGLLGSEAFNILTGAAPPALDGRVLVLELPSLKQTKHVVLRKPGCPVCGAPESTA